MDRPVLRPFVPRGSDSVESSDGSVHHPSVGLRGGLAPALGSSVSSSDSGMSADKGAVSSTAGVRGSGSGSGSGSDSVESSDGSVHHPSVGLRGGLAPALGSSASSSGSGSGGSFRGSADKSAVSSSAGVHGSDSTDGVVPVRRRGRGADVRRRARRVVNGAVALDADQAYLLERLNHDHADGLRHPFALGERDQAVLDFLMRWRYATRADVGRVGGWRGWYGSQAPRLNIYRELGLVRVERVPLSSLDAAQVTSVGARLSRYGFLGVEGDVVIASKRSHGMGLSSLASQLLSPLPEYDGVDLLGLGDDWAVLRGEIRSGDARVIAEREYRSAWSRVRSGLRSPRMVTPRDIRHAMREAYSSARRLSRDAGNASGFPLLSELPDFSCCDPACAGRYAWLWTVFGGDVVRDSEMDAHGRPVRVDASERALEDGVPVLIDGDRLVTRDHLPDMVIARHRDLSSGRPRSLAVELELTAKPVDDYSATMSAFMSPVGRLLYSRVIWLVVQASVATLIRKGAALAGAREGRDYTIVPVYSEDMRSSFHDGADMLPGRFDVNDSGVEWGYSLLSDIMARAMERDGKR